MFSCVYDRILLGDGFFEKVGWKCFQGPICLGALILATFLIYVFLGVGLLRAVRHVPIQIRNFLVPFLGNPTFPYIQRSLCI